MASLQVQTDHNSALKLGSLEASCSGCSEELAVFYGPIPNPWVLRGQHLALFFTDLREIFSHSEAAHQGVKGGGAVFIYDLESQKVLKLRPDASYHCSYELLPLQCQSFPSLVLVPGLSILFLEWCHDCCYTTVSNYYLAALHPFFVLYTFIGVAWILELCTRMYWHDSILSW